MSWKPEVVADSGGHWTGNALRFTTKQEAEAYAYDLMTRWTLVRDTRAVEHTDPATHRWIEGKLVEIRKE
jgi:hypothetical protein